MAETVIYHVPTSGPVVKLAELPNPLGGAAFVWRVLGERFIPEKPWPTWGAAEWSMLISYLTTEQMTFVEKVVLCSTLDYAVIETEQLIQMSDALLLFANRYGETGPNCQLLDLARFLESARYRVTSGLGLGLRHNTASGDPWLLYDDAHDIYRPYDTSIDRNHWPLFHTLQLWIDQACEYLERELAFLERLQEQRQNIISFLLTRSSIKPASDRGNIERPRTIPAPRDNPS